MAQEIWKVVTGYEDLYSVSNLGRVKSHDRIDSLGRLRPAKVLKPGRQKNGYMFVNLYKDGKHKTARVHRLVASAFVVNPNNYESVNHIDEDKENNSADNLEWCTHKENINHGTALLRSSHKNAIPVIATDSNGEEHFFYGMKAAERVTGVNHTNISACCKGRKHHNTAGGYTWRYA